MEKRGLSANVIKWAAIVSMFLDHTAVALIQRAAHAQAGWIYDGSPLILVYDILRILGRFAFPLFCFMLLEGYFNTRSVGKYSLRLFIFALISELPFDMALYYYNWDSSMTDASIWVHIKNLMVANNVYFTLLIGLLMIWGLDAVHGTMEAKEDDDKKGFWWYLLRLLIQFVIFLVALVVAESINCDYGGIGIIFILILFVMRHKKVTGYAIATLVFAFIFLVLFRSLTEFACLVTIPLIAVYNGERGKQHKYLFYAFYPVHLLLLAGIAVAIGLPLFL